jgi:hypothetical protein
MSPIFYPFDYLKDLFTRLPAARITEVKQFTPAAWAKSKASERAADQAALASGQEFDSKSKRQILLPALIADLSLS